MLATKPLLCISSCKLIGQCFRQVLHDLYCPIAQVAALLRLVTGLTQQPKVQRRGHAMTGRTRPLHSVVATHQQVVLLLCVGFVHFL